MKIRLRYRVLPILVAIALICFCSCKINQQLPPPISDSLQLESDEIQFEDSNDDSNLLDLLKALYGDNFSTAEESISSIKGDWILGSFEMTAPVYSEDIFDRVDKSLKGELLTINDDFYSGFSRGNTTDREAYNN